MERQFSWAKRRERIGENKKMTYYDIIKGNALGTKTVTLPAARVKVLDIFKNK